MEKWEETWDYIYNLAVIMAMAVVLGLCNLVLLPVYLIRWITRHIYAVMAMVLLAIIVWMVHIGPGFFGYW